MTVGQPPKPYVMSRQVVLIIEIILSVSALLTVGAVLLSGTSYNHLLKDRLSRLFVTLHIPLNLAPQNPILHQLNIDKKLVLIQHEFGINGTTGGATISLNKGDTVQITIINAGKMAHNFGIAKLSNQSLDLIKKTKNEPLSERIKTIPYDVVAAIPCPGCVPKFERGHISSFILPDERAETTFQVQEAGNFKYFCMVRGHLWLGMMGDFIVHDSGNGNNGLSRNE